MLTNTDSRSATDQRTAELELEVARLEGELKALTAQVRRAFKLAEDVDLDSLDLDAIDMAPKQKNPYVFDVDDSGAAAFDDFFNTYDPHLIKTRSFLLD